MNKRKWERRAELGILEHSEWFAKLAEEFGEVAKEMVKLSEAKNDAEVASATRHLYAELEHVGFVSLCFRTHMNRKVDEKALALAADEVEFDG